MTVEIVFEDTVSYKLAKVTTAYRTTLERQVGRIGLHAGQVFVLLELWNQNGLRQIDLARRLDVSAPTVNKMLKGLIEINLIKREREDDDARSTRIFLTRQGMEMRAKVENIWRDLEVECVAGLTETDRLVLLEVLGKLRNTFTGRQDADEE